MNNVALGVYSGTFVGFVGGYVAACLILFGGATTSIRENDNGTLWCEHGGAVYALVQTATPANDTVEAK